MGLATPGSGRRMPVELRGGPGDGTKMDREDGDREFRMYETRRVCDNPDHIEARVHAYDLNGNYLGSSNWALARRPS